LMTKPETGDEQKTRWASSHLLRLV
jgi:hypothetical protein